MTWLWGLLMFEVFERILLEVFPLLLFLLDVLLVTGGLEKGIERFAGHLGYRLEIHHTH